MPVPNPQTVADVSWPVLKSDLQPFLDCSDQGRGHIHAERDLGGTGKARGDHHPKVRRGVIFLHWPARQT